MNMDVGCCFKQILEAEMYKIAAVLSNTYYLTNHPSYAGNYW